MSRRTAGLLAGIAAYGTWGVIPIYFKAASAAPPLELLAHRVVWALVLLVVLLKRQGRLAEFQAALRPGRTLAMLAASTVLIAVNWLVYIWAVVGGRVLEGSLGYFINPLVNVVLGVLVLKEKLERPVMVAVAVAALGVAWLTLSVGRPPWVSLALAASFGSYGLIRKVCPVGAVVGLAVETLLLFPLALGYLAWARGSGRLAFLGGNVGLDALLVLAGPVTRSRCCSSRPPRVVSPCPRWDSSSTFRRPCSSSSPSSSGESRWGGSARWPSPASGRAC